MMTLPRPSTTGIRRSTKLVAALGMVLAMGFASVAPAQSAGPSQVYYIPFPENNQLAAFQAVTAVSGEPLAVFVTYTASQDNTVIYYDHWEDGYEEDITNPQQSTTQVFGDGNPANGFPPGNPGDLITAGTVFSLRNFVTTTNLVALDYDARDKVASFKPIALTKTTFPTGTNTLLAGCIEVFEQGLWGTEYRVPVGENMPTTTATATLAQDYDIFSYTAMSIMAGENGASVQIDANNDGTFEQTVSLAEGETTYVTGVSAGARVLATNPVQVEMFTGRPGSNYQSRDTTLLPVTRWSTSYYAPVSTNATYGTCVFLYNPGATAITVSYDYRNSATSYTTATVSVPAGGNARVNLAPANGTTHFGAYKFYTTGGTPPVFYAFCAVDANSTTIGNNQAYDGGFTLVGTPSLSTQVLVSLGVGRDPYSLTNPTENGNPVWITTVGNGNTQETVYVDYNGDNSGPLTDPNGFKYDVAYSLRELQQQQLLDPDGDQTGMFVYTLNANVKLAAAYAQNPNLASASQPGVDVATLVPPLREGDASKSSNLAMDSDGDGTHSAGDTLEYDIRVVNTARAAIPGPFTVKDTFPADTTYVPGSTRYRYGDGTTWQPWVAVADDGSGTPFPLDGTGLAVPGTLAVGTQLQVVFQAVIDTYPNLDSGRTKITNTGTVEITPYGVIVPLNWSDIIYGSIGDRVWNDIDGDGVQDAGEAGINGVVVFIDLDNDGIRDVGESWATTAGDGNYLIAGLTAGTYTVRVDPASIAAVNVAYGPTYDLDGVATSYVATVPLLPAQDRTDVDFGFRTQASLGDRVWLDRNANGVQDAGEPGINGVRVYIDTNGNDSYDVGEPNSITFGDGTYYIGNLTTGAKSVRVDTTTLPPALTQTYDLDGTGTAHEAGVTLTLVHRNDVDFGYVGNLSIGNLVWNDVDANGTKLLVIDGRVDINASGTVDGADDGFIGTMRVVNGYLDIDNDASTTTPDTGDDGTFQGFTVIDGAIDINGSGAADAADDDNLIFLPNLVVINGLIDINGSGATSGADDGYTGNIQIIDGYLDMDGDGTTAGDTGDDGVYRGFNVINGWIDADGDGTTAGDGGDDTTIISDSAIAGARVYVDVNGNGVFDAATEPSATTNSNGVYTIGGLYDGTYTVRVDTSTLPASYAQTFDITSPVNDHTATVVLAGTSRTDVDFAYRDDASLGDYVWNDLDNDGVQDPGEPGIPGVIVYLDTTNNNLFDPATERYAITDANGYYLIDNLASGTYEVRIETGTLPAGTVQTYDLDGIVSAHTANRTLVGTANATDVDFGYRSASSLGDRVWLDTDGDGVQDGGEVGINGVRVYIDINGNGSYDSATEPSAITAGDGAYAITGLIGGTYTVRVDPSTLPAGTVRTYDLNGPLDGIATVPLTSGQTRTDVDFGYIQPASVGDFVWNDVNGNGQQDVGEPGIGGVTVTLYRAADDAILGTTTSSGTGAYVFADLIPGTYYLGFGLATGFARTSSDLGADATDSDANAISGLTASFTLAAGQVLTTVDAGYSAPATIGDFVWNDSNANGIQDGGEAGLGGVVVYLYRPGIGADGIAGNADDALPIATTTSSPTGAYQFTDLPAGTYEVEFTALAGYTRTTRDVGANDAIDSDAIVATGRTGPIGLTAGQTINTIDAGYSQTVNIGDFVWNDSNANGIQDGGETGLGGVTVSLFRPGFGADGIAGNADDTLAVATTTSTAGTGAYAFTGLPAGTYQVGFGTLAGYNRTLANQGVNDAVDSDADASTGLTAAVAILPGTTDNSFDAGYYQPAALGDLVWNDSNANGQQDGGEAGLNGVTVTLFRPGFGADGIAGTADDALAVASTTTAGGGAYSFTGLRPGSYEVEFGPLAGYNRTLADQGADTSDSDADPGTGRTAAVLLVANATNNTVDAGYYQPASIGDFVWEDMDWDGQQDAGEPGLTGVLIRLFRPGFGPDGIAGTADDASVVATTTSGSGGAYGFTNLPPGTYQVEFTPVAGYVYTVADTGADVSDSDANATTGLTANIVLAAGAANTTIDAGYRHIERIGDRVWNDFDADGIQDAGEPGIVGVQLQIYTAAGAPYEWRSTLGTFADDFDPSGGLAGSDGTLGWATNWTAASGATVQLNTGTDYEIRLADTNGSAMTRSFVAPAGTAQLTISFTPRQGVGNDTVAAQWSENGTAWTTLATYNTGVAPSGPTSFDVTTTAGTRYIRFIKTAAPGGGGTTEYFYFDDVNIIARSALNTSVATTDANGYYYFDGTANLLPSTAYQIRLATAQAPLSGFSVAPLNAGSDDAVDSDGDATIAAGFLTIPFTSPAAQGYNETYDFGLYQPATIGNRVWNDTNNDGLLNNGESGINGVTVQLFAAGAVPGVDAPLATTTTATSGPDAGVYTFSGLGAGGYFIHIPTPPPSATASSTPTVASDNNVDNDDNGSQPGGTGTAVSGPVIVLAPAEIDTTVDFGFFAPAQLAGQVREDTDGDGSFADPDTGIAVVTITLFTDPNGDGDPADGTLVGTTTTNGTGNYSFTNLVPGNYVVVETNPPGYTSTADIVAPNNDRIPVVLAAGDNSTGNDFLDTRPANIRGQVRYDIDGDGAIVEVPADAGIAGVTIRLFADSDGNGLPDGPVLLTTTTAADGTYEFLNVMPGGYVVNEVNLPGYTSTADVASPNNDLVPLILLSGTDNNGNDFLDTLPAGISGQVRDDLDGDGDFADPDTGIAVVTITLFTDPNGDGDPADGTIFATTTTDGGGNYSFPVVPPGNYVVVETNPPGFTSTNDVVSPNDERIPVVLLAGGNSTGNDFLDTRPADISGQVRHDVDADGNFADPDGPLAGVQIQLFADADNNGVPDGPALRSTSTDASGNYLFTLVTPGRYLVVSTNLSGFSSTADTGGANDDTIPVVLLSNTHSTGNDFLDTFPPDIRGQVRLDVDGDGNLADSDSGISGVTIQLFSDPNGDGDPADGALLRTTTTDGTGNYEFLSVQPGLYVVVETDPSGLTSTADVSAPNDNRVPVALVNGTDSNGNDFLDTDTVPVDISGQVRYDADGDGDLLDTDAPIPGVTIGLYSDPNEDGDPGDGVLIDTRTTDSNGSYLFEDVPPGYYVLVETNLAGQSSTNDVVPLNDDRIPVQVTKFDITGRDFLDTCPSTWADYQTMHPTSSVPSSNVDKDTSDSLVEYSFDMSPESGAGNPFCIGPSPVTTGVFAGGFTRPKRATQNVRYTLEYAAVPGNPTVWSSIPLTDLTSPAITITDNGDCTETILLDNLEAITGLTGGKGVVRIRVELDADNDSTYEYTSWTESKGWTQTDIEACGLTYNNPYQRCPVFSGTVDEVNGVTGQSLNLVSSAGAVDLSTLLNPPGAYYIEVIAGDNEGQRFDVVSATATSLVLASDSNLDSIQPPFNTLLGAPPASLAGDKIELRRHYTLGELCPPVAFSANEDPTRGDQIQVYAGGVYHNFVLFDDSGNARWVLEGDGTLADAAGTIIAPGQGIFLNGRGVSYDTAVVAYGELRQNKFVRPLSAGFNLVGGGYPVTQSATGRAMSVAVSGFTGNANFTLADQFLLWRKDTNILSSGYENYYLLKTTTPAERWVKTGDSTLTRRENEILFQGNRASFYSMKIARPLYVMPLPWTP